MADYEFRINYGTSSWTDWMSAYQAARSICGNDLIEHPDDIVAIEKRRCLPGAESSLDELERAAGVKLVPDPEGVGLTTQ